MVQYFAVPAPLSSTITDLLNKMAGWGRGRIVGKFEILRVQNDELVTEIANLGGILIPAPWRSFSAIHPSVSTEIASAIPNQTFITVGDFMSHVHGHDRWSE